MFMKFCSLRDKIRRFGLGFRYFFIIFLFDLWFVVKLELLLALMIYEGFYVFLFRKLVLS